MISRSILTFSPTFAYNHKGIYSHSTTHNPAAKGEVKGFDDKMASMLFVVARKGA